MTMKRVRRRRGVILVLVMVVVALLALTAYAFTDWMLAEGAAVQLHGQQIQAGRLAESGVEKIRHFLRQDPEAQIEEGGHYENPDHFQGALVIDSDDPLRRGRFTVIAPSVDDDGNQGGLRYGLENESSRMNLNVLLLVDETQEEAGRELLMGLPGMTVEIADAILDWIDPDDDIRPYGAEAEHYSGLTPPYGPRNGPLLSVEELLLVRDVTPDLLFGLDVNRNGLVDPQEQNASLAIEVDNSDGSMDRGWSAYLTLYSMEGNRNSLGEPRIYINQEDMQQLHDELSQVFPAAWVTFIVGYRQNGPYLGSQTGELGVSGSLDLTKAGNRPLTQVLDLIGNKVRVKFEGEEEATVLDSPFVDGPLAMGSYLPTLMDHVTINDSPFIPGRININQAPRTVLQGIPGLEEEMLTEIISRREVDPQGENPNMEHETWLLSEAIVTLDEMRALMPFVTAGGDVFRAQVVGYFESGEASARYEVVIDATADNPGVLFWRNLSHLGRGYALEVLGIDMLPE